MPAVARIGKGGRSRGHGSVVGGSGLLGPTNFVYQGSFRLPTDLAGSTYGFQYYGFGNGSAVAYNPANNSLFITGSNITADLGKVAEVSIPALVQGDHPNGGSTNLSALNTATFLQNFSDVTAGALVNDAFYGNGVARVYGLIVYGGKLYGSVIPAYDASQAARVSHFRHGLTLATNDFFGWETVHDTTVTATYGAGAGVGMIAGYLSDVPSALQSSLGGPVLGGQFGLSILSRLSIGPSAFTFDPAQIGSDTPSTRGDVASSSPVTASGVLYYPNDHRTLGDWNNAATGDQFAGTAHTYYSWSDFPANGIIEDGTFFVPEVTGVGHALNNSGVDTNTMYYGRGVTDWALNGTLIDGTGPEKDAYDLAGFGEGTHGWPYAIRVILYAVSDLQSVKAGSISAWTPVPYGKFDLPIPFTYYDGVPQTGQNANGVRATYDRTNRLLYIVQTNSIDVPTAFFPLVHVYHVTAA